MGVNDLTRLKLLIGLQTPPDPGRTAAAAAVVAAMDFIVSENYQHDK